MHRKLAICAVAVWMLGCGDWTRACPEGFQYDHERRVCVRSGAPPEVDSGSPPVEADSGIDAGTIDDAGEDVDAQPTMDAGGDDASVETDGGS